VLLLSGAVTWADLAAHRPAWDLMMWLSILFSMCTALAEFGVIKWIRWGGESDLADPQLR
jgi:di/tricarboxylate transporter